ncbi:MAG: 30S ribosomal protein S6 [Lewinella sp.]|nr:30S ribosomal protein S6 [Lewinella sp.]
MRDYEVTFIVDPVLSGEEIKATAQAYNDLLKQAECEIVHVDEMGLRTLAYPINRRNSGVYYCIEFKADEQTLIDDLELAFRRDERIMRFLTVKLDKFGVKYNEDKRNGLIAKAKRPKSKERKGRERDDRGNRDNRDRDNRSRDRRPDSRNDQQNQKPAAKQEAPKQEAAKQEEE